MKYEELIQKKEAKKAELVAKSKDCDINELRMINERIQELNDDIMEMRIAAAKSDSETKMDERTATVNQETEQRNNSPHYEAGTGFKAIEIRESTINYDKEYEKRAELGAALKEKKAVENPLDIMKETRAITVSGNNSIVVPTAYSSTINRDFEVVSSLIDGVSHLSLNGGESYKQPYVIEIESGGYTAEGANYQEAETKFDEAEINKAKITAYHEITKELLKLPNAPYADYVFSNLRTSMRMQITKEILVGNGGTNEIVGIFSNKATAIDSTTDLAITTIDDTTLDEIVYRYGGLEEVEDAAVLVLNKLDLLAFSKVRTSTKQSYYQIKSKGNYGTINGIPFIINSACKQLTGTTTTANDYCMCYGQLSNYQLVMFSAMEIERSDDFKFKQGIISHRGEVLAGGNVVRHNGFLRVKKK